MKNVADLRKDYRAGVLDLEMLAHNPMDQFANWFSEASADPAIAEANAMTLSTASAQGDVTSRVVLLKGFGPDGLRFFTNYESRKGTQIAENPRVALNFHWPSQERQIKITGTAQRLPKEESEAYFQTRPLESRLGAWASNQSRTVSCRAELEAAHEEARARFADGFIPMPPYWGGYLVVPQAFEFWQGRSGRLHDRFRYSLDERGIWNIGRLAP
jgi:pyridoxamine 5'-phosphate oxidase